MWKQRERPIGMYRFRWQGNSKMGGKEQDQRMLNLLTFRHRVSSIYDTRFTTLQRTLFIYLINKYISLSDICLTVHH